MRRHPFTVLLLCWLVFVGIVVLADCLLKPAPVTLTEAPTRVPIVTVTPAATTFVFATTVLSPTVTPREAILSTPRPTSTRVTPTATLEPTMTPAPARSPVQRG